MEGKEEVMTTTFDSPAVQRFTTDLENQRGKADTDSKAAYQQLELRINSYADLSSSLMDNKIREWPATGSGKCLLKSVIGESNRQRSPLVCRRCHC
jgi:hypothetical protein